MKVLVNLATLKKGGGQNVGLNFLRSLLGNSHDLSNYYFVIAEGSEIDFFLKASSISNYTVVPQSPLRRMLFERFKGGKLIRQQKIDIIYTIFGIGLYPKRIKQVSGSADSNIFFPEVDFWKDYKGVARFKKTIVDKYRVFALKRSTAVVFENESMMIRSKTLFNLKHTIFIKPSIDNQFEKDVFRLNAPASSKKGLFFCGWQKNKNYEIIPSLAQELKNRKIDFHFILTAPNDNSEEFIVFENNLERLDVKDMVSVIGQVKKNEIASLYDQIDFVFLLSKLESFSNNIIESWFFKRPLILADEEWSNSICKEAAKYVNRNNIKGIVDAIVELSDKEAYQSFVHGGVEELTSYPSIDEKTNQELNYIREIYESH
ncbi:glycosyltransferase [Gillisia hiemivivida]|uniref:Glycosyltransferase n=1 Tax=Gillisia hiemivivida TaxID=291190 RepID=A0A5C7A1X6_9FLAO|nr:glycosyltransferase [Gillisia hiemivivida]TXD95742.1 glycosyltransferase [Gillisia hiemivivida]